MKGQKLFWYAVVKRVLRIFANGGKVKRMFIVRSKAAIVRPRSFYTRWLIVCLYAGIISFTTVTLADPGSESAGQDEYLASTHPPSIEDIEELTLDSSTERFGQPISASIPTRPTINLAAPGKAFVQDISIRVLQEAYDKLGYKLVVHKLPNLRSLMSANNGKYDGEVSRVADLNAIYPNLHRVPTPVNVVNIVALGRPDSANIHKIENIQDNPLCVRGNVIVEILASENHIQCVFVVNIDQVLAMVSLGRAKYALVPETNARISLLHSPVSNVQIISPVLHSEALYHYLNEKNLHLVEPLNKVLKEMRSSGEIEQIRSDYFASIPSQSAGKSTMH